MEKKEERICFILNPGSDRSRSNSKISRLEKCVKERWKDPAIYVTSSEEDLIRFAEQSANRFDTVVACGGDGTANGVMNAIVGKPCRFALLPIGSGNDLAKAIGLPLDMEACIDIIYRGKVKKADLVRYSGDRHGWFGNTLGFGFDGWANYFAGRFKRIRGSAVYAFGALRAALYFRGEPMELFLDGERIEKNLLMVTLCNGAVEGGNFKVAPEANIFDGWLDVLLIEKISVLRLLCYLPRFLVGPGKSMKGVCFYRCRTIEIRSTGPVAVHCDGEFLGSDILFLKAELAPAVLDIVIP
ncbi:MAG: YegS/Rv2252/BmrU family lipid kinase [Balneolaceae bacterium]